MLPVAARAETPAPAAAEPVPAVPMAVGWALEPTPSGARLSFDVSSAIDAKATFVEGPDRVIIDLPQVNFQIDPATTRTRGPAAALVRSFRFGVVGPGKSRIVIDLGGPATVTRLASTPIANGDPSRLVIALDRTDRATFHKAVLASAAPQPEPVPAAATAQAQAASGRLVVVIDPGHGGIDPGANGLGGIVEKSITLQFAELLASKLTATGRYTVVMTRSDDSFVSLGDRVRIARDSNAALFVSVHADTVSASESVTGATVYTCSDRASDAEAARVAAKENDADAASGVSAAPEQSGVNDILFDLTRRETRTYAHLFQRTLVGYWQKIARLNKNPERSAGFKVLQAPDVPSVLLELGYLSSEKDVQAMTSPAWRDQATTSIVTSIDAFFAPRQPAQATAVVTPAVTGTAASAPPAALAQDATSAIPAPARN